MDDEASNTRDEEIKYKESFKEYFQQVLEEDYEPFIQCNSTYLRRAIRVNTIKADVEKTKQALEEKGWTLTQVPWCKQAFWIKGDRLDIGNLREHQLGHFYIQDPASMLPPIVLNPKENMIVLDMCAAPGSKTSQAAAMMNNTGIIIANDADSGRHKPLSINIQKLGVANAIQTCYDGRKLPNFQIDAAMVDVPCSGTGTIRRSIKTIKQFNVNRIAGMAKLQLMLAEKAFKMLKPGGIMTYSTCSIDPVENEGVITKLIEKNPDASLMDIQLDIKREKPFLEHPLTKEKYNPEVSKAIRILPQTNDTEGFFVVKIQKA